ncbi:MAG: LOG family protein [Anaerolineales bacterium]|nr:LOG family protein [Anaerolineales bacterium]
MNGKRVTVFGGAKPLPGETVYQDALRLGKLLGESGYIVLNGGYIGTMEAVSRGAKQAGGHVIGVTCAEIENWRPVKPNPWISEELRYPTLRERLLALIENCDAALALPGGVGTLAEIVTMWNHLLTDAIPPRPLILIGAGWQAIINQLYLEMDEFIPHSQRDWITCTPDVETAVANLREKLV